MARLKFRSSFRLLANQQVFTLTLSFLLMQSSDGFEYMIIEQTKTIRKTFVVRVGMIQDA